MSEDSKPVLGKQWRGQSTVPVRTAEDLAADQLVQKEYAKPDAISLDTYLSMRGVRDPAFLAGMKAYTVVRHATVEDWQKIFATY